MALAAWMSVLLSHSFIRPFLVLGNLKPGSRGPTAAATRRQAEERGVSGEEWAELELESRSCGGVLLLESILDVTVSPLARDSKRPTALSGEPVSASEMAVLTDEIRAGVCKTLPLLFSLEVVRFSLLEVLSFGESSRSSPEVAYDESAELRRLRLLAWELVLVVLALPLRLQHIKN